MRVSRTAFSRTAFLAIGFLLLPFAPVFANDCSTTDIELATQSDVNDFQFTYGPCTEISGSLTISGVSITDLTPLSDLVGIGDGLAIWETGLVNLEGLESVVSVDDLYIGYNEVLVDMTGLDGLPSAVFVTVENNEALTSFTGLENLATVNTLDIYDNPNLLDLSGLDGLTEVLIRLKLSYNASLHDLSGLENLTHIRALEIVGNSLIDNIDALSNVSVYDFGINIWNNPELTSISGLIGLSQLNRTLSIQNNPQLVSLTGLESIVNLPAHGAGSILIRDNDSLTDLRGLDNLTVGNGSLRIEGNDSLVSLTGLENLVHIGKDFIIANNPQLRDFEAMESFWFVNKFEVYGNDLIADFSGLSQLEHIGSLSLFDNQSFSSFDGLPSLTEIESKFLVYDNPNLAGFEQLSGVSFPHLFEFWIARNDVLTSLSGLENVIEVASSMFVTGNSNLFDCRALARLVDDVDDLAPGPGPGSAGIPDVGGLNFDISNNMPGCNSVEEILTSAQEASEPSIRITRSPNPLNLVADQPGEIDPTGTATITNTGGAGSVLTGECSLADADPQLTLTNGAFSIVQGAPGHVVTMSCDASAAGSFSATLSCTHNGTKALNPRTFPVKCVVNELADTDTETGPQVPCGNCANRTQRPLPVSGPWADPEQDGSGFLFRIQDGTLVGFYFGYGDAGDSDWLLMNGVLEPGDTPEVLWQLQTHLSRFTGGSCPGCDYAAPGEIEQTDMIRVEFLQKNHARFRVNGGAWHYLVPVLYGTAGYAYFPESTPYLFPEMAQANGDPAPWVYVINLVDNDGLDHTQSRLVHLNPNETMINQGGNTSFRVESVELTPLPDENPVLDISCAAGVDAETSVCMVTALDVEYQWLFTMPFANLGANRFFADDELGNSIEAFRIGYD